MKAKMVRGPSWADLPTELLFMIAKCLESRIDICRFGSVCTSWRSSVLQLLKPLQYSLPLVMDDKKHRDFYLVPKYIYCIEPITGKSSSLNSWIIAVEERISKVRRPLNLFRGSSVRLLNLFTGEDMPLLPSKFPKGLNLSDFRITELQKLYRLESVFEAKLQKVVLLDQTGSETVIVVLKDDSTLSFFKLGTEKWELIWKFNEYPVQDIAGYRGKVCVTFEGGRCAIVDSSFNLIEFASPTYPDGIYCTGYLEESLGDLFLVDQITPGEEFDMLFMLDKFDEFQFLDLSLPLVLDCFRPSMAFKVYMLHPEEDEYKWIEVMSLGDRVMFISSLLTPWFSWCFSVPSHQIPGLRNCIVLADSTSFGFGVRVKDSKKILVFNMETCKLEKVDQYPEEFNKLWPPLSSLWQV